MKKTMNSLLPKRAWSAVAVLIITAAVAANANANLVANPDFELGNTGFFSDYPYSTNLQPEGLYSIVDQARDVHPSFTSAGDHTTGTGLYFVANGSSDPTMVVWQTETPIIVSETGTAYRFEAYITSLVDVGAFASPILRFQVGNGVGWFTMGTSEVFPNGYSAGVWRLSFYDGVFSATGSYYLRLLNDQTAAGGNDLGLDDIYFGLRSASPSLAENPGVPNPGGITVAPIPEPTSLLLASLAGLVLVSRRRMLPL